MRERWVEATDDAVLGKARDRTLTRHASLRLGVRTRRSYDFFNRLIFRMSIAEVRWVDLPNVQDHRGVLTAMEAGRDVPFEIRRAFFLHGVTTSRGGHAHRISQQFLVPVSGRFRVTVADGDRSTVYELTDPHRGLYVPPLVWVDLDDFSSGAVCLVLTDTRFDEAEYVRDWETFVHLTQSARTG